MESIKLQRFKRSSDSYQRELKARRLNLPVILILLYSIPISMSVTICQTVIYDLFTKPARLSSSCLEPVPEVELRYIYIARLVENLFLFLAYPISGWLADIKLGRGVAVGASLWLCWFGMIALMCSYLVQYSECGLLYSVFKYSASIIGLLLLMFGMADFHTNSLAYMIDQMPDASTNQIRSYIRWFTWTLLFGFGCDYIQVLPQTKQSQTVILGTFSMTFFLLTLVLCIHQLSGTVFVTYKPIRQNPYTLVFKVLQFAWKNKNRAINRSSLTYWEDKTPSRIDLGMRKYGGPFSEKDIENVKSFGKLFLIFMLLGGIFIPYFDLVNKGTIQGRQYEGADALKGYSSYVLWQAFVMIGVILVPVVEFVVIPCFPKFEFFFTSPMKGLVLAHVAAILALVSLLGIQGYAFAVEDSGNHHVKTCFLTLHDVQNHTDTFNVPYQALIIPCVFVGFYVYLTFSETFQVVCSQAPHEMSGMLFGIFWLTRAVFIGIGVFLSYSISLFKEDMDVHLCSFWTLVPLFVIASCGLFVFSIFLCFFSGGKGTVFENQHVIEEHYTKYLNSEPIYANNGIINDYTVKLPGWSDNVIPHDSVQVSN